MVCCHQTFTAIARTMCLLNARMLMDCRLPREALLVTVVRDKKG